MAYVKMSMAGLDRPPAHLKWEGVVVEVDEGKIGKKQVLFELSGEVKPGSFLAIMGPSGAGKTTLLNCLAQRFLGNRVMRSAGSITINNVEIEELQYKLIASFVPQDDILMETLTVRENVTFSATMTLNLDADEIKKRVEHTLTEVGLIAVADHVIGGTLHRGISGGEKKRASIAYELVNDPAVLFLDEPTTGLDSFTAMNVMDCIQKQSSKYNRTVIATIHQPNSETFDAFDRLYLLSGGHLCYNGHAKDALQYFAEQNYACPKNYNPADYYMNLLCSDELEVGGELKERISKFENYAKSRRQLSDATTEKVKIEPAEQAGTMKKFGTLLKRTVTNALRSPIFTKAKLAKCIYFTFIISIAFWQLGYNSRNLKNRGGGLFTIMTMTYIENMFTCLTIFQSNKALFEREYASRKYGVLMFYITFNIILIPFELFWAGVFISMVYFIVNFNYLTKNFFKAMAVMMINCFAGATFGLFDSVITPDLEAASAATAAFIGPFMLTSGLLVNNDDIPDWFFIKYFSPMRYAFEAFYRNEFDNLPGISDSVSDTYVHNFHFPEHYDEALTYLVILLVGLRILTGFLLLLKNRHL
jgi:ATP-binding cassette subfamily G (WHITE) protein 1